MPDHAAHVLKSLSTLRPRAHSAAIYKSSYSTHLRYKKPLLMFYKEDQLVDVRLATPHAVSRTLYQRGKTARRFVKELGGDIDFTLPPVNEL